MTIKESIGTNISAMHCFGTHWVYSCEPLVETYVCNYELAHSFWTQLYITWPARSLDLIPPVFLPVGGGGFVDGCVCMHWTYVLSLPVHGRSGQWHLLTCVRKFNNCRKVQHQSMFMPTSVLNISQTVRNRNKEHKNFIRMYLTNMNGCVAVTHEMYFSI